MPFQLERIAQAWSAISVDLSTTNSVFQIQWEMVANEQEKYLGDLDRRTAVFARLISLLAETLSRPVQLLAIARILQNKIVLADRVILASSALAYFASDREMIDRIMDHCRGAPIWEDAPAATRSVDLALPLRAVLTHLAGNQLAMLQIFQTEPEILSTSQCSKLYLLGSVVHYTIYQYNSNGIAIADSAWEPWLRENLIALDRANSDDRETMIIYRRYLRNLVQMLVRSDQVTHFQWATQHLTTVLDPSKLETRARIVRIAVARKCSKLLSILIAQRYPISGSDWRELGWHAWRSDDTQLVAQIIDAKIEGVIQFDGHDLFRRIVSITNDLNLVQVARSDPSACSYFHNNLVELFRKIIPSRTKKEIDQMLQYFTERTCSCGGSNREGSISIHPQIIPIDAKGHQLLAEIAKMCQEEEIRKDALLALIQYSQTHPFPSRYYLVRNVLLITNQWELDVFPEEELAWITIQVGNIPVVAIPLDDTEISFQRATQASASLAELLLQP